ncbi:MAG: ribonuclease P protein component [Erysipelotrichaceae bacterium]|nr:ribonuclease P protein component [Erysipelotrichaceae bacterium]
MKKDRRVRKSQEFQEILSKAQYVSRPSFVIYYEEKKQQQNRIGISVGKKLGNAVHRNLIKRQVRMMMQETEALALDCDMIVIVRRGYLKNDYAMNKKCLETMLETVKIRA